MTTTDTPDIEALVTWLLTEAADWETEGEDYEKGWRSPTAQKLRDAADALKRQQAVVEALRMIKDCASGIMPIHKDMNDLRQKTIKANDARWTRLFAIYAEATEALAALDAPPEGEG